MNRPNHFRRCHVCGAINMQATKCVEKCADCGKHLAPFFYFDDRFLPTASDFQLRAPLAQGEMRPIHGLTAYWENF